MSDGSSVCLAGLVNDISCGTDKAKMRGDLAGQQSEQEEEEEDGLQQLHVHKDGGRWEGELQWITHLRQEANQQKDYLVIAQIHWNDNMAFQRCLSLSLWKPYRKVLRRDIGLGETVYYKWSPKKVTKKIISIFAALTWSQTWLCAVFGAEVQPMWSMGDDKGKTLLILLCTVRYLSVAGCLCTVQHVYVVY